MRKRIIKISVNADLLTAAKRKAGIFVLLQFVVTMILCSVISVSIEGLFVEYQFTVKMMKLLFLSLSAITMVLYEWKASMFPVFYAYLVEKGEASGILGVNPFLQDYTPGTKEEVQIRGLNLLFSKYCLFNPAIKTTETLVHYLEAFAVMLLVVFFTGKDSVGLLRLILFAVVVFTYIGFLNMGTNEFLKYLPSPLIEQNEEKEI